MPEGDTIFKTAAALRPMLEGRPVLAARARRPGPAIERVVGATITRVEPFGKHLVLRFSNGLALHTHLRMGGSWHRYAPGERWRRPVWQATVVLEVPEHVVVCFNAPTAELMHERALEIHPVLQSLGPDLLAEHFDAQAAFDRLRAQPDQEIASALLDQRILAGVGNVFKSEILFIERVHPLSRVRDLDDATVRRLIATAERLLRANVRPGAPRRITTREDPSVHGNVWVYSRSTRPCYRCGTRIASRRQGPLARWTYWCPSCQA